MIGNDHSPNVVSNSFVERGVDLTMLHQNISLCFRYIILARY